MGEHIARLSGGSLLTEQDILGLGGEIEELHAKLDRARGLAAKLEEVVAMRTAVLAALVDWSTADLGSHGATAQQLNGIVSWAMAQLEEVP